LPEAGFEPTSPPFTHYLDVAAPAGHSTPFK